MAPAKKTLKYIGISKAAFEHILSLYPSTVPENLRELDALRYDTIPATVRSRSKKGKYLTKDEVVKLVEWKLYVMFPQIPNRTILIGSYVRVCC